MINKKDIIESGLFLQEAQAAAKLIISLRQMETAFKGILDETTKLKATKDVFKDYEKLKDLTGDVDRQRVAIVGLNQVEEIHKQTLNQLRTSLDKVEQSAKKVVTSIDKHKASLKTAAVEAKKLATGAKQIAEAAKSAITPVDKLTEETKDLHDEIKKGNPAREDLKKDFDDLSKKGDTLTDELDELAKKWNEVDKAGREAARRFKEVSGRIDELNSMYERTNTLSKKQRGEIDKLAAEYDALSKSIGSAARVNEEFIATSNEVSEQQKELIKLIKAKNAETDKEIEKQKKLNAILAKSAALYGKVKTRVRAVGGSALTGLKYLGGGALGLAGGALALGTAAVGESRDVAGGGALLLKKLTSVVLQGFTALLGALGSVVDAISKIPGVTISDITLEPSAYRTESEIESLSEELNELKKPLRDIGINVAGDREQFAKYIEALKEYALAMTVASGAPSIPERRAEEEVAFEKLKRALPPDYIRLIQDAAKTDSPVTAATIIKQNLEKIESFMKTEKIASTGVSIFGIDVSDEGMGAKFEAERKALLELQLKIDKLSVGIVKISSNYEQLKFQSEDSSLSLAEQARYSKLATAELEKLVRAQLDLALARQKLAETSIKYKLEGFGITPSGDVIADITDASKGGKISQEEADAYIAALNEFQEAVKFKELELLDLFKTRREARSDELERELDFMLDAGDKMRDTNIEMVEDEKRVFSERLALYEATKKATKNNYVEQVKALIKFQSDIEAMGGTKGVTLTEGLFAGLLEETDAKKLSEEVTKFGFSDVITGRIIEIILARQAALKELADVNVGLQEEFDERFTLEGETNLLYRQLTQLIEFKTEVDKEGVITRGLSDLYDDFDIQNLELEIAQLIAARDRALAGSTERLRIERELAEKQLELLKAQTKEIEVLENKKREDSLDAEEAYWAKREEMMRASFELLRQLNEKYANDRIGAIDRELEGVQERQQYLIGLAEQGSEMLTENLATEQRKQAELEKERERIDRARQRRALIIATLETYTANLTSMQAENRQAEAAGLTAPYPNASIAALGKTALDTSFITALVAALPAFYEGTEDTGKGGFLDDKNGFLSILHPHERVMTAEQNKRLMGLSNEEVVRRATTSAPVVEFGRLEEKLDTLIKVTADKPVYTGGDYSEIKKTFTETVKTQGRIQRKHYRTDGLF